MKRFFIFFTLISFSILAKAKDYDSLLNSLNLLPLQKQLNFIDSLSFNEVVGNSRVIVPILIKFEKMVIEQKRFNSLAKIYVNLSLAYYYAGEYENNLKFGLKALHLYDSLGNENELGTMYGELGYQMKYRDLNRANELMRKGIVILEKLKYPGSLSKIYNNYGVLKEIANQFDSAKYFYSKSLVIKKQLRDSVGIPYSLNNICMVFMLKNQHDSALYYLNQSTKIRKVIHDDVGLCENYSYYGQIYFALGDYDRAITFYQSGLALAQKQHFTSLIKDIYKDLSEVYERRKDYQQGLSYQRLYKQYADSLLNLETNKALLDLQMKYQTSEKEKALIQQTNRLERQRLVKIAILIGSIIVLISTVLFFRNKILTLQRIEKIKLQEALIEGEQAERNRLALELHDSVANDLNGVMLLLNGVSEQNNMANSAGINRSIEKLKETHQQVRKLSHTLMPRSLSENGLKYALTDLIRNFRTSHLTIDLQVLGMDDRLKPFIEFNLFCIVQEALNNIVKHSKATNVFIECNRVDDTLLLSIEDNGVGFEVNASEAKDGIGLQNISNRVKMMGGKLNISSSLGDGTSIEIHVNLS